MKKVLLLFCFSFSVISLWANIRLPKLFADSMVLQRDQPIPVWGWADKNETVTIQLHNQKKTARAGKEGKWRIMLQPERAGGPYTLTVTGNNKIQLQDILVGDVWICSGQSNMEWPVAASYNAAQEIASANFPQIRHFKVVNSVGDTPKDDLLHATSWKRATPQNAGAFTAIGYFFARELHQQLGVPIGLLNTTWGGTDVETWTSRDAFANSAEFKSMIAGVRTFNLDSAAKERETNLLKIIKNVQGGLPDSTYVKAWPTLAFNDARWTQTLLPQRWEEGPLPDLDGVVWFRKTIALAPGDAGKPAELHLAMIDDNDVTYVNGEKVGTTNGHNVQRIYTIPAGVLKEGKNVIAVRAEDSGGGGSVYGDAADMKLVIQNTSLPLSGDWRFQVEALAEGAGSINPNTYPTLLYNAMIHPLIPFAIKGALWYQGENNAGRAYQYRTAFPLMIRDWRKRWGRDFPFYFVQLASFNADNGNSKKGSTWAELREAQTMALTLPHTGMAVTTDLGDPTDIHPRNKQDVGLRLAVIALHDAYGKNNVFSGPMYQAMKGEGNKIILSFSHTGGGLVAKDKYGYLKGFEVAGADQQFHYGKAVIQGNEVVVYADSVAHPVAVRFAWADDASEANLYNKEGFPAVPFRTDNWKGITEGATYRNLK